MVSGTHRQTAQIYEFSTGALRQPKTFGKDADMIANQYSDLAFGNCWYHDEAVRESAESKDKPVN